ncbi:hypothetical protein, partial [Streptomyces sp. DSM 41029]
MQISDGSHGDRALIVIRTRSASDGISMTWTPEHPSLLVVIEEGRQILQMAKDNRWKDVLDLIDDLYTLARA